MSNPTRWVGIDLHRRRSQIAIIDEHGELALSRRIVNDPDTFRELLGDPRRHARRARGDLRLGVAGRAAPGGRLRRAPRAPVADAGDRGGAGEDRRGRRQDARAPAAHRLLPEAYIAPPELRDLRELLRHRAVLTRMRTAVKNRVHALLARQGIRPEHADLFGKAGREFLAGLELPEGSRRRLDSLMSLIADFDREITATTREIDARAKTDERVTMLCQIRGVGRYTAMLVIAEVGDVKRFPTARHLCAWAGLAPTVRSSDGKARLGHISRQGSPALRWALTEAAQKIPTGGGPLRAMFERIAKRRGRSIAKVAVARQILTLCYYGLRDGEIRCLKHQPTDDHDDDRAGRGRMTNTSSHQTRAHEGARCMLGRARSCVWPPPPTRAGRP